jgi:hypothetical protein
MEITELKKEDEQLWDEYVFRSEQLFTTSWDGEILRIVQNFNPKEVYK